MFKNLLRSRKIKYGSVAVAFTAIFIAFIILLNAVLSAIDARSGLYFDTTPEKRYDIGEQTSALVGTLEQPVEIVFLRDRDKLMENNYMSMIITLAEKYESSFSAVSVKFIDRARNAQEVNRFRRSTSDIFYDTDVIVSHKSTGKFRHLRQSAFFTTDGTNIVGFNGEMRLTASILAVSRASDEKIALITGHDEMVSVSFSEVLVNAGYDTNETLVTVNLTKDEIPQGTKLVVISNPKRDFNGFDAEKGGSINEIAKLDKYLKNYGNLLVFLDNETGTLPELSEYLSEEWGISYKSGLVIEESAEYSTSTDGRSLVAQYNTDEQNHPYANEIARRVTAISAPTVMNSSTPLYLDGASSKKVSPILTTSPHARVLSNKNVVATGTQTLMAISTFMDYPDGKYEKFAHVIVSGSTDCIHSGMDLTKNSNANADLIYSILSVVSTEKTPIDIPTKLFTDTSIAGIGTATARNMTVKITLVPTLLVLALGIYVFIKRSRA